MLVRAVKKSRNIKTGKIPVTTSPRSTCPSTCAFYGACYAEDNHLGRRWDEVDAAVEPNGSIMNWSALCDFVRALPFGQVWRHNQAGDLPGSNNRINRRMLAQLVRANKGKLGFTYTHKPLTESNLTAIRDAIKGGFCINISANSPAHADTIPSDLPIAVVMPESFTGRAKTPQGRDIIQCPAQYLDHVTCASCKLCARPKRKFIVGFAAHGVMRRLISQIVQQWSVK